MFKIRTLKRKTIPRQLQPLDLKPETPAAKDSAVKVIKKVVTMSSDLKSKSAIKNLKTSKKTEDEEKTSSDSNTLNFDEREGIKLSVFIKVKSLLKQIV